MKGISASLVAELRRHAAHGANVPDLLRLLHGRLGREAIYGTTLARYFMAAFELPLRAVSPIGGWAPDSSGEISDVRIHELIYPEIVQKNRFGRIWIDDAYQSLESVNSEAYLAARTRTWKFDGHPVEGKFEKLEQLRGNESQT